MQIKAPIWNESACSERKKTRGPTIALERIRVQWIALTVVRTKRGYAHMCQSTAPSSATKWRIVNRICVQLAIQEVSFRFIFSQTLFWANP